jgi:hypothetical protein
MNTSSSESSLAPTFRTRAPRERADYSRVLQKLSAASVKKHFDAYADIPWDAPEFAIDLSDPRWAYDSIFDDPLAETAWYRSLPQATKNRLGLHAAATFAKIGIQFESILQRGLLEFADELPNGSPEFRYAYHEVIEEGHHSLMFQEFVNRSREDVDGMPGWARFFGRRAISYATLFPELFFLFVLGGEEPIDHVQREGLSHKETVPPLLRRIAEIHVTEEARHISFARAYLRKHVPALPAPKRMLLATLAPTIFGRMVPLMLKPSQRAVRTFQIPDEALRQAYDGNARHRERMAGASEKVRVLCAELGLMPPHARALWKHAALTA